MGVTPVALQLVQHDHHRLIDIKRQHPLVCGGHLQRL
ncbi:MAG: hypothetical protein RLZ03_1195 [Pseudomonadota bacterium]